MTEAADLINPCVRCQYDLRGVADDQPCPECGLLAERSRRPSERLRDSRPAYLRKLSLGLVLIVLAAVTPILWWGAMIVAMVLEADWLAWSFAEHVMLSGADVAAMLLVVGTCLLTAKESNTIATPRRSAVRLFACIPLTYMLVMHVYFMFPEYISAGGFSPVPADAEMNALVRRILGWLLYLLIPVAIIPFPILLFSYLAWLGKRLLSRELKEHSFIIGVGISVTIAMLAVAAVWGTYGEQWLDLPRRARGNISMALAVICFTLVALFALWSFIHVIGFALAFWRESRALKALWQDADRSVNADA